MAYALKNIKILDGHKDMIPVYGKAILIQNEEIIDIVDDTTISSVYKSYDMGGKYVLPGLINLHVHTPASGKPKKKKQDYAKLAKIFDNALGKVAAQKLCAENIKQNLYSGTTTIRACGGLFDIDTDLRDSVNAGEILGPRILAANSAITVLGGYMAGSVATAVNSKDEAARMVKLLHSQHPDFIKLMITGGCLDAKILGEPGDLKMPEEFIEAACNTAHELGYKVAAHVEGSKGLIAALDNGVDVIEHGSLLTSEIIKRFKRNNAAVVSTILPTIPFVAMDKEVTGFSEVDITNGKALLSNMVECYKQCLKNGIPLGLGTDAGSPFATHYDFWRELYFFCKFCNVSASYAIHSATLLNAKIAEIDDITGSIDIGKSADLMIVDQNPLNDISALREPNAVVIRGEFIANPQIKRFEFVDQQLDNVIALLEPKKL